MDKTRLISYLATHISPIDFILEYQNRSLPVSILFYKMCNSYPKEKLGGIKGAFKHLQVAKLSPWTNLLTPEEIQQVIKGQNNIRPKAGQYIEFLAESLLISCGNTQDFSFSDPLTDIKEGWDFKYQGMKFDFTTNLNKIPYPGVKLIKIPVDKILDQGNLILPNALSFLGNLLKDHGINLAPDRLDYSATIVNKVRSKYLEISRHQVIPMIPSQAVVVEKPVNNTLEIPDFNGQSLPVENKSTKVGTITLEDMDILSKISTLNASQRQQILMMLKIWSKN